MIKVQSSKFKVQSSGFTLIELLVAVAVLGLVVLAGTSLFFTSLKSERKTESLTIIKQSGDYALKVMSTMIRNAKEIVGSCSPGMSSIEILNPDGGRTEFTFGTEGIASNGASLTSAGLTLSDYSFDCSESAGTPPTVIIDFTLSKGDPGDILGYASQQFKTTVSLRTY